MPTTRMRHMITETDDVVEAIEIADRHWPELRSDRAALLRRLIQEGAESASEGQVRRRASRIAAIRETAGSMAGIWPDDAVQQMRDEWPE